MSGAFLKKRTADPTTPSQLLYYFYFIGGKMDRLANSVLTTTI